jgi:glycosyltransferase involved in cell wall biosynthesis
MHLRHMDFLVLSHLRWNFVFQRPQQLMTRCSGANRVFFWEEPIYGSDDARVELQDAGPNLHVAVPHLPAGLPDDEICRIQEWMLAQLIVERGIQDPVLWYYTPMALGFSRSIESSLVVYDCMDELSAFRGAPAGLRALEAELFARADVVFTGGETLYQAKRLLHPSVHCFPSSIDRGFFATARRIKADPDDQGGIPRPRLGYCGVIDERMDLDLLRIVAEARPDWQFVMVGPVVKISSSDLPQGANIHYLGAKGYHTLPSYMAGWDVGLLPFARNESTRFISPTKTPEYLAAGIPVVSTPITDVVCPYGTEGLVHIAETSDAFIGCIQTAITNRNNQARLARVDSFLSQNSWDQTWHGISSVLHAHLQSKTSDDRAALVDRTRLHLSRIAAD